MSNRYPVIIYVIREGVHDLFSWFTHIGHLTLWVLANNFLNLKFLNFFSKITQKLHLMTPFDLDPKVQGQIN